MRNSILFLLFLLVFSSCKKEPTTWDVDALAPLLTTKMSLQQAVPDSLINVDPDGELNLVYKGTLIEFNLDSVFAIPDTEMVKEVEIPDGTTITLQPGEILLADTLSSPYNMEGAQITLLKIDTGVFHVFVRSSIPGDLILEYSMPGVTKNGAIFYVKETIPAGTVANPTIVNVDYDISGYVVDLTGPNNTDFNLLTTQYKLYADPAGTAIIMNSGDKLLMGNTLEDISPSYARGYFGSKIISENSLNDPLDAFNNIIGGTVNLDQVTLDFNISNEIGVDIVVNIDELSGRNTHNNTDVSLNAPIIKQNLNLNRATETGNDNSPINSSLYQTVLDKNNSNVTEFISNLPDELSYQIGINLNPLGNVSGSNDFVYDSTGISIELDAEIPIKFNAKNLTIVDTSDFNIEAESQDQLEKVTGGFLNIHADNWYPFSLNSQYYMLDENNTIIDSIFAEPQLILEGNPVAGKVTEPTYSLLQAPVSSSKIDNLYRTKSIITKMTINTPGADKIQIYEDYFIDLKIVGDFKYLISIN